MDVVVERCFNTYLAVECYSLKDVVILIASAVYEMIWRSYSGPG